jgi:hypothetical protein
MLTINNQVITFEGEDLASIIEGLKRSIEIKRDLSTLGYVVPISRRKLK